MKWLAIALIIAAARAAEHADGGWEEEKTEAEPAVGARDEAPEATAPAPATHVLGFGNNTDATFQPLVQIVETAPPQAPHTPVEVTVGGNGGDGAGPPDGSPGGGGSTSHQVWIASVGPEGIAAWIQDKLRVASGGLGSDGSAVRAFLESRRLGTARPGQSGQPGGAYTDPLSGHLCRGVYHVPSVDGGSGYFQVYRSQKGRTGSWWLEIIYHASYAANDPAGFRDALEGALKASKTGSAVMRASDALMQLARRRDAGDPAVRNAISLEDAKKLFDEALKDSVDFVLEKYVEIAPRGADVDATSVESFVKNLVGPAGSRVPHEGQDGRNGRRCGRHRAAAELTLPAAAATPRTPLSTDVPRTHPRRRRDAPRTIRVLGRGGAATPHRWMSAQVRYPGYARDVAWRLAKMILNPKPVLHFDHEKWRPRVAELYARYGVHLSRAAYDGGFKAWIRKHEDGLFADMVEEAYPDMPAVDRQGLLDRRMFDVDHSWADIADCKENFVLMFQSLNRSFGYDTHMRVKRIFVGEAAWQNIAAFAKEALKLIYMFATLS